MAACDALAVSRATFYRHNRLADPIDSKAPSGRNSPLALTVEERNSMLELLHSEKFIDLAPHQIYAKLLDQGVYLCSVSTMYRLLKSEHGNVKERRNQVQRASYTKPELLATGANQVWSWDITKLKAATKWTYFYLCVIIDIFSRYVVGWMVATSEQKTLAKHLIEQSYIKHNIEPDQLTLHADRGSSMKSKVVVELLVDLGVLKTHSRPHVSDDNPFSEAQFKTMKYCPQFPDRFGCIQDARAFCIDFFSWYNNDHQHTGIGLMTPYQVHYGLADDIHHSRAKVLKAAFEKHPERFKGSVPQPPRLPDEVWINKPKDENCQKTELNLLNPVSHFH